MVSSLPFLLPMVDWAPAHGMSKKKEYMKLLVPSFTAKLDLLKILMLKFLKSPSHIPRNQIAFSM